jgi:hypothetical protein
MKLLALFSSFAIAIVATATDTSFLRKSSTTVDMADDAGLGTTGETGVLIVIEGVTNPAGADNDIVTHCLVNAFNKVHKNGHDDDYVLHDAAVVKDVVVPTPKTDNDSGDVGYRRKQTTWQDIKWGRTRYDCRLCHPNVAGSNHASDATFLKTDPEMHKALEAEFRNELIASGDATLAKVTHVEVDFTTPAMAAASFLSWRSKPPLVVCLC